MTTREAYEAMKAAMATDPSYAWSWHCNIAMPLIDNGIDEKLAQKCAAQLMQHFWGVDTAEHQNFPTARGNAP